MVSGVVSVSLGFTEACLATARVGCVPCVFSVRFIVLFLLFVLFFCNYCVKV